MKKKWNSEFVFSKVSIWHSWEVVDPEIAAEFAAMRNSAALQKGGPFPVIWKTSQKFVLKIQFSSGLSAAYKTYSNIKAPWKKCFRYSPSGAEALNFQKFTALGIPMPRLLASGDCRRFGLLRGTFLMTEFAEGFRNGRDFVAADFPEKDAGLRDEFLRRNLLLLARCHQAGIWHRGFTPANLLYRRRAEADAEGNSLDLMWIDVATCRKLPRWILRRMIVQDFFQLFRFFSFDREELIGYLTIYNAALPRPFDPPEVLAERIQKAIAAHKQRKHRQ